MLARATAAGGALELDLTEIANGEQIATVMDPRGAVFGVHST